VETLAPLQSPHNNSLDYSLRPISRGNLIQRVHALLVAQGRRIFQDQVSWFLADDRPFVEKLSSLTLHRGSPQRLNPTHVCLDLALEPILQINDLPQMSREQLSTQRGDNHSVRKARGKAHHMEGIGAANLLPVVAIT
jgi:hypothetical protein